MAAIPYGFFGVSSINADVLQVQPNLPSELDYWTIENLAFCDVKYDLTIFDNAVRIDTVRGDAEGLNVQVVLNAPKNGQKVYVNGVATNRYTVKEGKAYVTLPLEAASVQVL